MMRSIKSFPAEDSVGIFVDINPFGIFDMDASRLDMGFASICPSGEFFLVALGNISNPKEYIDFAKAKISSRKAYRHPRPNLGRFSI